MGPTIDVYAKLLLFYFPGKDYDLDFTKAAKRTLRPGERKLVSFLKLWFIESKFLYMAHPDYNQKMIFTDVNIF